MSSSEKGAEVASAKKVFLVVSFYVVVTIAMVLTNKYYLKQVNLPVAFLWSQLIFCAVALKAASRFTHIPEITVAICKQLAPLIAINVIGLTMNTLCLHYMDAMLYQIARSIVLPITAALTPILGSGHVSWRVAAACTVIFCGFIVGMFGGGASVAISPFGVTFGILSSFTTALHSFVIKSSLNAYKSKGPFDMVYLNNALSSVVILPLLLFEAKSWPAFFDSYVHIQRFLVGALVTGCLGLLVNVASFMQIKTTSPLTHTVSSAARGVFQSLGAWFFLSEMITSARAIGIGVTLAGSCLYSWVKSSETAQEARVQAKLKEMDRV